MNIIIEPKEYYLEIWTKNSINDKESVYTTAVREAENATEAFEWASKYFIGIDGMTIRNIRKI